MKTLLLLTWVSAHAWAVPVQMISGAELKRLIAEGARMELIDVRVPTEYMKMHLSGARNIPFNQIKGSDLKKDRLNVLYCSAAQCTLATESARALMDSGFKKVKVLEGGLEGGMAAGITIEGVDPSRKSPAWACVSGDEVQSRLANDRAPLLVDVRPENEFKAGHLPGARNIPLESLAAAALDKEREIVVYDRFSVRSKRAASQLSAQGFKVTELEGGIGLWSRQRRPLETR